MSDIDLPQVTGLLTAVTPFAWIAFYVWRVRRSPPRRRSRNQPAAVETIKRRDP